MIIQNAQVAVFDLTQNESGVTADSEATVFLRHYDAVAEQVRETAIKIYSALECKGLSRVDFFVEEDGGVVFNEINTLPGFTSISMYPKLFAASGIAYDELLDQLLQLALEAFA